MSTNAMCPPACEMASVVAMNVWGTLITISPGSTPAAMKAKRRASVPLFTPTQNFASQNRANSRSNSSTMGPPMKPALLNAFFTTANNSSSSSLCDVTRSRNGTFVGLAILLLFLLCDKPQKFGGISGHNGVRRYVLGYDAACSDNGVLTDSQIAENRGAGPDGCSLSNQGLFYFPVRFCLQLAGWGCRARIGIIDKGHAVPDEDVVFDLHALANKGVAGNLAASADTGILLDFHEGPNFRFISDFAAVQINELGELSKFINLYGCEIGDETKIGAFVEIQKNASVGRRCKISSHTFICEGVEIEDNVFIGHSVTFINDSYPRSAAPSGELQTEADWKVEKTLVRKGASIGSGSTILSNLTIGENAIVGAGSVVTKDVPANTIVAGNPAKFLRFITEEKK